MAELDGFALPTHVFTEKELAELEAVHLESEDYDAVEAAAKEELAPIDERAPCEGDEEVISTEEDGFAVPSQVPDVDDDDEEFALPQASPSTSPADLITGDEDATFQPFEGSIPSSVLTCELQKAMFRARLIFHHTFESVSSKEANMLNRLIDDQPEAYADCIVRLAVTQFIAWKETVGL